MKKKWLVVLALVLSVFVWPSAGVKAQETKKVMTTFYPVYFLAKEIAGDKAEVDMLLNGGQEAHTYDVSAQDANRLQDVDLFIYQDDEMEFFVQDLLQLVEGKDIAVLESTEGIELLSGDGHDHDHEDHDHDHEDHDHEDHDHDHEEGEDHDHDHEDHDHEDHDHDHEDHNHEEGEDHDHDHDDHDHGHDHEGHDHTHEFDPHTWLSPKVYAEQAANVRDALIELDPDNKATYEENAANLIANLETLEQEYRDGLAQLENRTIVVQHAAFGYLAHEFDLDQKSIAGLSTNQEPSAKVLSEMQTFIKDNNIGVIYVDPSIDSSISETVAGATGAELLPLSTLEVVTPQQIEEGVDYFTLMRDNLQQLVKNQ